MTPGTSRSRRLSSAYADTVDRVKGALAAEGFGVLTEVDVRSTRKAKLDAEFPDYLIIRACNPSLAYQALSDDLDVGLLLPCNVIVRADGQGRLVSIFDPVVRMAPARSPASNSLATEAKERLQRALEQL